MMLSLTFGNVEVQKYVFMIFLSLLLLFTSTSQVPIGRNTLFCQSLLLKIKV